MAGRGWIESGKRLPARGAVSLFRALRYHWGMEAAAIEILLNGRPERIPAGASIGDLLQRLGLAGPGVAVAVNKEIVRREAWGAVLLSPGDRVEIIHAVGGG